MRQKPPQTLLQLQRDPVVQSGEMSIPIGLIIFALIKWMLILFVPHFYGQSLFDPFALIQDPADRNWTYWLELNLVYVVFMIPLQELLARGGLQGLLERFLAGKHRVALSIFTSNLIFSSVHVFLSPYAAIGVFFVGCYVGILYARTHNLIGCCFAHAIAGVLALSVFGIVSGIFG